MIVDSKLSFSKYVNNKISKTTKSIGLLRKLKPTAPFIRPHLDNGDVIFDQPSNASSSSKIESVQYNTALAIKEVIKGSSRDKLYHELGPEFLQQRK